MKLKIKRPSTYIRYKDDELTASQRAVYQLFIDANSDIAGFGYRTLAMAKPIWGRRVDKRTAPDYIVMTNDED